MPKVRFGDVLHHARSKKKMSLRELSAQSGIEYTRLSRMEHGTRPAPGLPQMRRLADLLSLDLVDLLVSAGTPREAVEQLLWAERLEQAKRVKTLAAYSPEGHRAGLKNEFEANVVSRDGAMCSATLGTQTWSLLAFSDAAKLRVIIPPEAIQVFLKDPRESVLVPCNVFNASLRKIRRIGALLNLVLEVGDIELNALIPRMQANGACLETGTAVFVSISPVALSTEPV
jgi:transcriptional regulator with XRE-family HTH domain